MENGGDLMHCEDRPCGHNLIADIALGIYISLVGGGLISLVLHSFGIISLNDN